MAKKHKELLILNAIAVRFCCISLPNRLEDIAFAKRLQISYNLNCPRETNLLQEVKPMCNNFNFDCGSLWQALCQYLGWGC